MLLSTLVFHDPVFSSPQVTIELFFQSGNIPTMILETIPALRQLTVEQKMRLSWELADEVSKSSTVTPEIMALLDERLDAYEADPSAVKTTDEVTAGLMALKQRLSSAAS